jgi:hypothetical protein
MFRPIWTHSIITQQEEQPVSWNTHAHRGDHVLKTEATIIEAQRFFNYNIKHLMMTILVETCSEQVLKS